MKSDLDIINLLKSKCFCKSKFIDDKCIELSLTSQDDPFTGTVRHYSFVEKQEIIKIISELNYLEMLDLRKNNFYKIDDLFLPNLKFLDIGSNCLNSIPNWLKNTSLESLNIGANEINFLPDWFSDFSFVDLKIHKNKINNFPILKPSLRHLNFYLNDFKSIPDCIFTFNQLNYLCFGNIDVHNIDFKFFDKLNWLTVVLTPLEKLSDSILDLPLIGMKIIKNNLSELPFNIGQMRTLSHLALCGNKLTSVPDSFFDLNLSKLNISNNLLPINLINQISYKFKSLEFFKI